MDSCSLGGDLAELGVFHGASALLIGDFLQEGEAFTVVDLFDATAVSDENSEENRTYYPDLIQETFEKNYLSVHSALPRVVKGPSESIVDHATHGTHRFVHIDASHLYEHVVKDIVAAQTLLKPDGIVVLDDYRAEHTPGVAAAAWHAVLTAGLRPFALSPFKMYATWGDASPWEEVVRGCAAVEGLPTQAHMVNGHSMIFAGMPERPARHWAKKYVPEVAWPMLARVRRRVAQITPAMSALAGRSTREVPGR